MGWIFQSLPNSCNMLLHYTWSECEGTECVEGFACITDVDALLAILWARVGYKKSDALSFCLCDCLLLRQQRQNPCIEVAGGD